MNQQWKEIAREMGCTDAECKRKWSILRNSFAREERSQKTKRKPWYLQKHLAFLRKYIHHSAKEKIEQSDRYLRDNQPNFCIDVESNEPPRVVNQSLLDNLEEYSAAMQQPSSQMSDPKDYKDITLLHQPEFAAPAVDTKDFTFTETTLISQDPTQSCPADDVSNFSTVTIKSSPKVKDSHPVEAVDDVPYNQEANSNHLFLTSLLPDMNKLSEKKQRVFKRKTIELLEILFEADEGQLSRMNGRAFDSFLRGEN